MNLQRLFRAVLAVYLFVICHPVFAVNGVPANIEFEAVKQLSSYPPVIMLSYADGRKKVLRLTSVPSVVKFEKFVSDFLNIKAAIYTPEISVLDKQETSEIVNKLTKDRQFSEKLTGINQNNWLAASLSDFLDGYITGSSYLHLRKFVDEDPYAPLSNESIKAVPEDVRTRLFDLWALLVALGVRDFHSGNWLIHELGLEPRIVPIDLNARSEAFLEGLEDHVSSYVHHPFSKRPADGGVTAEFIQKNISDKMRRFLLNLSVVDIGSVALGARYPITLSQIIGIRQRSRFIALDCTEILERKTSAYFKIW
jgi:hypothetical protein